MNLENCVINLRIAIDNLNRVKRENADIELVDEAMTEYERAKNELDVYIESNNYLKSLMLLKNVGYFK